MALSLHKALRLHWASPVVLRYQTADSSIRPRDDTAWREEAATGASSRRLPQCFVHDRQRQ